MANTDSLFLLIKAMSRTEKRYFKLYASKFQTKGSKDYLRLFDAIYAQKEYDENAIQKKFSGEPYFRQLRHVKAYLHKQILKSLRNFHDDSSSRIKLNNELTEIEILYNMGLFKECLQKIKRAKEYADKYDKFSRSLELLGWELHIKIRDSDIDQLAALQSKFAAEEDSIFEKYNAQKDLNRLIIELRSYIVRKGNVRTAKDRKFLRQILSSPILKRRMTSFSGKTNQYMMMEWISFALGNYEKRYEAAAAMIKEFDLQPHQVAEHINVYFGVLLSVAAMTLYSAKYMESEKYIARMEDYYLKGEKGLDIKNIFGFMVIGAILRLRQGRLKEAMELCRELDGLLQKHPGKLDSASIINAYSVCFAVYFCNKDFKNAQQYIQKTIHFDNSTRTDIQSSARIANLILQYEQQEYEHLGYVLQSAYRYLMKKENLGKTESIVLNFVRKILKLRSQNQVQEALFQAKQQLLPYTNEPFFLYFPIMEWIDSKLQKRPLVEIIKENYLKAVAREKVSGKIKKGAIKKTSG